MFPLGARPALFVEAAMSRYVTTQTSIYTDPDLLGWHPLTLFFYRYLYENDHVHGISGWGRFHEAVMRAETRLTHRQIERAKEQMGDKVLWFEDGSYWVAGRIKHTCFCGNGHPSPKHVAGLLNILHEMPQEVQKAILHRYPIDTLSKGNPSLTTEAESVIRSPYPEAVSETETERDDAPPSKPEIAGQPNDPIDLMLIRIFCRLTGWPQAQGAKVHEHLIEPLRSVLRINPERIQQGIERYGKLGMEPWALRKAILAAERERPRAPPSKLPQLETSPDAREATMAAIAKKLHVERARVEGGGG